MIIEKRTILLPCKIKQPVYWSFLKLYLFLQPLTLIFPDNTLVPQEENRSSASIQSPSLLGSWHPHLTYSTGFIRHICSCKESTLKSWLMRENTSSFSSWFMRSQTWSCLVTCSKNMPVEVTSAYGAWMFNGNDPFFWHSKYFLNHISYKLLCFKGNNKI